MPISLLENNFVDCNIYFEIVESNFSMIITLYVDNLILASNDLTLLKKAKEKFSKKFQMVDLGEI
jgi:hypothetical protein